MVLNYYLPHKNYFKELSYCIYPLKTRPILHEVEQAHLWHLVLGGGGSDLAQHETSRSCQWPVEIVIRRGWNGL